MNNRDIKSKDEYGQGSYIEHRPLDGNNFIYNQSNQGYLYKRNYLMKTDHARQNDKCHHAEQNFEAQKERLHYNNYNYHKFSNSGNNSYISSKFKDSKFYYGLDGNNNYYNKIDNYNINTNNNSYFRNDNKIEKFKNNVRDIYEAQPRPFNKRNIFHQNQQVYQNTPKRETRNYHENHKNNINWSNTSRSQNSVNFMPLATNNFQNTYSRKGNKEFKDKDYSNNYPFKSLINNQQNQNNTASYKESDKVLENKQIYKKMKISDKINFSVEMFNHHLNKTTSNLLGTLERNDKDTILGYKNQNNNEENLILNSTCDISNIKCDGLYNKFNIDNRTHHKNIIPFKTDSNYVNDNEISSSSGFNNLKNLSSSNCIAKNQGMINRNNNLENLPINISQSNESNNFHHNSQVSSSRNNHTHLITQNTIFPRKPYLIPNIKYKNSPFMFFPKNLCVEDKSRLLLNGNSNNINDSSNPLILNFISKEITPQVERKNLTQSHIPNYNKDSNYENTNIDRSDIKLQEEKFKISLDSEDILNDTTRNNTEETSDKSNALLSINSEFFNGNYEEHVIDPYSILDIKIKIREDEYRELSLKQNDDIEQISRDFCKENFLDNKYVPALCKMINKAVDSISEVFEYEVQLEDIDYLNDIYSEYIEVLNLEQEIDSTSLTNLSCLTVLNDSTDSIFKMSNTNLNMTM